MQFLFNALFALIFSLISGCEKSEDDNTLHFVVSADYPPFTFVKNGEICGFEVDLATQIAKKLGLEAKFQDVPFASITATISNGQADAAISAIARTESRARNFDFSDPYYNSGKNMAVILRASDEKINSVKDLENKKILCQLGSVMEMWATEAVQSGAFSATVSSMDNIPQMMESIKSEQFDVAIVEIEQAKALTEKDKELVYTAIEAENISGYCVMLPKGSQLTKKINSAIYEIKKDGTFSRLVEKWFSKVVV